MVYTHTQWNIASYKKNEMLPCAETWIHLEGVFTKMHRRRQTGYHLYVESKKYNKLVCVYMCVWLNDTDWLFATPWTVAHQAPLSMDFSRQEYWRVAISYSRGSFQLNNKNERIITTSSMDIKMIVKNTINNSLVTNLVT